METSPSSSQPELDRKITSILQHDKTLFGEAKELNVERLPTYGDILLHYFFMQEHYFEDNPHISFQSITRHVADKIVEIWNNLPTPIIQRKSICNKLDRFMAQYREASKNKSKSPDVLVDFRGLLGNLFWVSTCNCNLLTTDCRCQNTPLPLFMKTFFVDQMTDRNVSITEFLQTLPQPSSTTVTTTEVTRSEVIWQPELSMGASSMDFEFEEGVAAPGAVRGPYTQNVTLSNFAMECDRYGISNRAAAALASALLKDLSVKDKNDQTLIIDKNKVQRERNRCRNEVLKKRLDTSMLLAFAFDGRTDETLVTEFINNKIHTRKIKEPHIVVVREPDSRFLGHIIVEEETAEAKTHKLIEFFDKNGLSLDNLVAICSDGEPVNTGIRSGIIRLFEQHLQRPLHWSVCLLHFNELPFRHLYNTLEKSFTKGPTTSTGRLAAVLGICDTIQVKYDYFE